MAKKVGELIKEARLNAHLSQEKLASMIDGLSASDLSKAERGEKQLTNVQLKAIAKATGVTQKSLLEAAGTAAPKTSGTTMQLTASEKKLVELYRQADSSTKKAAMSLLKKEETTLDSLLSSLAGNKEVKDAFMSLFKEK